MKNLDIVTFQKKYKSDFERLNREWIEEYFQMEEEDFNTLQNPESHVIEIENYLDILPAAIGITKMPFWDNHWYYVAQFASNQSK